MSAASDESVKDAAREAVSGAEDIRAKVRDITLKALSEQKLDGEGIKQVLHSVTDGVIQGLDGKKEQVDSTLKQAVGGMDEALTKTAEAAKLATQEAMGRAGEFTDKEFKNALDQLKSLENTFIDTLSMIANQSSRVANESLKELVQHLKRTGTDAGGVAKDAASTLQADLAKLGKESFESAVETSKQVGAQIAQIASGILAGMADALAGNQKKSD